MWVDIKENFHFYAIRGQKLLQRRGEEEGTRSNLTLHLPLGRIGLGACVAAHYSVNAALVSLVRIKAAFLLVVLQVTSFLSYKDTGLFNLLLYENLHL